MNKSDNLDVKLQTQKEQIIPKEIERKFLVRFLPKDLDVYKKKEVVQGYLAITSDGVEIRLRRKGDKYFETIKIGSGKSRTELETEISSEQFDKLWPGTEGKRLEKTRYEIPHKDNEGHEFVIELDIYHGNLDSLITAEIEFKSDDDSVKFETPDWFGEEVTDNKDYKNQSLAIKGIPQKD